MISRERTLTPVPTGAPLTPAWRRLSRGALLSTLRRIETLPPAASGALVVGDFEHPSGMILVERNRLCWSVAAGMGRRLHEILRAHCQAPLGDDELSALVTRCRHTHQPLGEALVATGQFSAERIRAAMKLHSVESLLALDAGFDETVREWPVTWTEHQSRSYSPRYTFTAAELVTAVGTHVVDETEGQLIAEHLTGLSAAGAAAVAFRRDGDDAPVFVGGLATLWLRVEDLCDLSVWASAALAASPGFSPLVAHACAAASTGGAVAWRYAGATCAAVCPTGPSLQRMVTMLDNQSLAMVLATRLSVLDRVRERTALARG